MEIITLAHIVRKIVPCVVFHVDVNVDVDTVIVDTNPDNPPPRSQLSAWYEVDSASRLTVTGRPTRACPDGRTGTRLVPSPPDGSRPRAPGARLNASLPSRALSASASYLPVHPIPFSATRQADVKRFTLSSKIRQILA